MRHLLTICCLAALLATIGCGRPQTGGWSADDSQRAAASLAASLLDSRWSTAWAGDAPPTVAIEPLTVALGAERVDPEIFVAELRRQLVGGRMAITTDPTAADYAVSAALRQAQDDYGDTLYLVEASLVAREGGAVAWADSVQVRRSKPPTPATPGGKKSMAHDRKQPGDSLGSYPDNKATNETINLHVTKAEVSEAQLLQDLATLRRIDGVRSIQETVDERGTARLLIYVLPHRELEIRQRLTDMGWNRIRY